MCFLNYYIFIIETYVGAMRIFVTGYCKFPHGYNGSGHIHRKMRFFERIIEWCLLFCRCRYANESGWKRLYLIIQYPLELQCLPQILWQLFFSPFLFLVPSDSTLESSGPDFFFFSFNKAGKMILTYVFHPLPFILLTVFKGSRNVVCE